VDNVVDNVVRHTGSSGSATTSPRLAEVEVDHPEITLASDFHHTGDAVLVADGVGFQVDSRVLCAER